MAARQLLIVFFMPLLYEKMPPASANVQRPLWRTFTAQGERLFAPRHARVVEQEYAVAEDGVSGCAGVRHRAVATERQNASVNCDRARVGVGSPGEVQAPRAGLGEGSGPRQSAGERPGVVIASNGQGVGYETDRAGTRQRADDLRAAKGKGAVDSQIRNVGDGVGAVTQSRA